MQVVIGGWGRLPAPRALAGSESAVRVGGEEPGLPTTPPGFPALDPPRELPAFHRVLCTSNTACV